MDLAICINTNSFPADSPERAKELLKDAIDGVLQLRTNENERILFYYDSNDQSLYDLKLASNYSYYDFVSDCGDADLELLLHEIEDKSPALDALTSEQLDEVAKYDLYIPNQPMDPKRDIYGFVCVLDGYLLSLATSERWLNYEIRVNNLGCEGKFVEEFYVLKNICNTEHGKYHFRVNTTINLEDIVNPHILSDEINSWFTEQNKQNQQIIANKLKLAKERNFQGGEPLFKSLSSANSLREIRFSAFSGGAIRVLFKHYRDEVYILLTAFIKHNNDESYDQQIPLAKEIFTAYTENNGLK